MHALSAVRAEDYPKRAKCPRCLLLECELEADRQLSTGCEYCVAIQATVTLEYIALCASWGSGRNDRIHFELNELLKLHRIQEFTRTAIYSFSRDRNISSHWKSVSNSDKLTTE
eukprot:5967916-Amphidinium_carterae.3